MAQRTQVAVVYTDYYKAFVKIPHAMLIQKLHAIGWYTWRSEMNNILLLTVAKEMLQKYVYNICEQICTMN